MKGVCDVKGKFIKRGEKTKELSEGRANDNGNQCVPDKKPDNGSFGDVAFPPSYFRMSNEGNNSGNGRSYKIRKPEEIIIFDNKVC